MENSIKPIEIDNDYADILRIKEQFAFRFGYTRPKEDLIAFKNRSIAAIENNIYNQYDLQFYTRRIFRIPFCGCISTSVFCVCIVNCSGTIT